jgi:hypothetical protein
MTCGGNGVTTFLILRSGRRYRCGPRCDFPRWNRCYGYRVFRFSTCWCAVPLHINHEQSALIAPNALAMVEKSYVWELIFCDSVALTGIGTLGYTNLSSSKHLLLNEYCSEFEGCGHAAIASAMR